jgi:hypothetical protein
MSLWRNARDEVAGAWRSLRYDLRRRCEADTPDDASESTGTGLDTFGGQAFTSLNSGRDESDRPSRRLVAVSAFGLLALVGAAGSYFAVVNGLGALLAAEPSRAAAYPVAAEAGPGTEATGRQTPTSRLGYGTTLAPIPAPQAEPRRAKATGSPAPEAPPAARLTTTPSRTVPPVPPPCPCSPPAPTPTFPGRGSTEYPTAAPSTSGSPSVSPSTSASPSASPSDDAPADGDGDRRDRQRDHTGY